MKCGYFNRTREAIILRSKEIVTHVELHEIGTASISLLVSEKVLRLREGFPEFIEKFFAGFILLALRHIP
jgi:hypothetical protein